MTFYQRNVVKDFAKVEGKHLEFSFLIKSQIGILHFILKKSLAESLFLWIFKIPKCNFFTECFRTTLSVHFFFFFLSCIDSRYCRKLVNVSILWERINADQSNNKEIYEVCMNSKCFEPKKVQKANFVFWTEISFFFFSIFFCFFDFITFHSHFFYQ